MNSKMDEYKIFVDLFKGVPYLNTALTANIWFYALTGAIVANSLVNQNSALNVKNLS